MLRNKSKKLKTPKNWRKSLVKKLDTLVSEYTRLRETECVTCGTTEKLTNGHYYSRIAYSTRWDMDNCHTQCVGCNMRHEYDNFNYMRFMLDKYGVEGLEKLHLKFVTPKKYLNTELLEKCVYFEEKIKEIKLTLDNQNTIK